MKIWITFLIISLFVFTSCDGIVSAEGKVLDAETNQPIDSVSVSLTDLAKAYSDSAGRFQLSKMIYGSSLTRAHLLFKKHGYKPLYIYPKSEKDSIVAYLQKHEGVFKPRIGKEWIVNFYVFNKYVLTTFVVFTLFFVILKRSVRRKILWLTGIFFINLKFLVSYLDAAIVDFNFFSHPLFLQHYKAHPFAAEIIIPIVAVAFWLLYFFRRTLIIKEQDV